MRDRLLVVLPNWYGETLFTIPFLRALRAQCPRAFIATLGWPRCREILLHHPQVNELLDYDEARAHRSLLGKWRLVRRLRARRFETVFILRRSLSRTVLAALAGIPTRIGFANPKSGWLLTRRVPQPTAPQHKAAAYLPLLGSAGSARGIAYDYYVSAEERAEGSRWLAAQPWQDGAPLIVLHPGANWPHKRWPAARFAALGDRLIETCAAQLLITGGPADRALAASVRQHMRHPAILAAGQRTIRQIGALLERAQLLVSNDTGVAHLAAAIGTPLVALYGPTSPVLTGPLGDPQRTVVLHHGDCCPRIPCDEPDRPVHLGMNAISVDEAYAAAVRLLKRN